MTSCDRNRRDLVFATVAVSADEMRATRLLVESVRAFGGELSSCPIWIFGSRESASPEDLPSELGAEFHELEVPDSMKGFALAEKVVACAEAERLVDRGVRSLVWMSSDTLVVNPPVLYEMDEGHDAALRPVHIRNVGMPVGVPLDNFWQRVMEVAGIQDTDYSVESFVDRALIRAYFNSHSYCANPSIGLFQEWLRCFEKLVNDAGFQEEGCSDELHKIFLHQAVLSALTVAMIPDECIRILPPTYSYPYNLQMSIPPDRRVRAMNELVSVVYEDLPMNPDEIEGIEIQEPLRSWLRDRSG